MGIQKVEIDADIEDGVVSLESVITLVRDTGKKQLLIIIRRKQRRVFILLANQFGDCLKSVATRHTGKINQWRMES